MLEPEVSPELSPDVPPKLSHDQQRAVDAFETGKNVFLTGPGGTGKSFLIQRFAESGKNVQVCAMTGTAAMLLGCKGATTLHSWAGIGTGTGDLVMKVSKNYLCKKKWIYTEVLIVDEVSMLNLELFEKLDQIGKHIRHSKKPFGGLQIVFCGDFCQLPPVNMDDSVTTTYCFQSTLWRETFQHEIILTTIHRQKNTVFCKILNQIREGRITTSSFNTLMQRVVTHEELAGLTATYIVPTRAKADYINTTEYKKLDTEEYEYTAKLKLIMSKCREHALTPQKVVDFECDYLMNSRAIPRIQLKVGTHVMCTHNVDATLCNGSQGIVRRFECGLPVVEFLHEKDNEERIMHYVTIESEKVPFLAVSYMPLMYAWAITIHKAQGATLHTAVIDIGSGIFEKGQTYTALSRLSSLERLYLTSFDPSKIKTDPLVLAFYQKLGKSE